MVDTYGAHETRTSYVEENDYGKTPATPTMISINCQGVDPGVDPNLIQVRGLGSRDLQSLTKGLQRVMLKIPSVLTSESPISFIQHVQTLNSLSVEVIYYKGLWASATDIISFLYKGCKINRLNAECHIDEGLIKAYVELLGQDVELGTAKIGSTYGDYAGVVPFYDSFLKIGDPDGSSLVANERMTDWKFTVENNLKPTGVIRNELGNTSDMTSNANKDQKVVSVTSGAGFAVGDKVKIEDDAASEVNWIVSKATNDLTMRNNLVNNYTMAANGKVTCLIDYIKLLPVRHRNLFGEITFEFESNQEYVDVIQNKEFSIALGLGKNVVGGYHQALFKYCKWKTAGTPTTIEDLVYLVAPFVARDVYIS